LRTCFTLGHQSISSLLELTGKNKHFSCRNNNAEKEKHQLAETRWINIHFCKQTRLVSNMSTPLLLLTRRAQGGITVSLINSGPRTANVADILAAYAAPAAKQMHGFPEANAPGKSHYPNNPLPVQISDELLDWSSNPKVVARANFTNGQLSTGWLYLEVQTRESAEDVLQARAAGIAEGYLTRYSPSSSLTFARANLRLSRTGLTSSSSSRSSTPTMFAQPTPGPACGLRISSGPTAST
jgi:hypothetical protein